MDKENDSLLISYQIFSLAKCTRCISSYSGLWRVRWGDFASWFRICYNINMGVEWRPIYLLFHMVKKIISKNLIYQSKGGKIEFRGDFNHDTIWGNLNQIARLFGVQKAAVSKHIKNIYRSHELEKKRTVSKMETVQKEGNRSIRRSIEYYNLDAIISVGYRINSQKATKFRIWATKTLKEHLVQGYTINKKLIAKNYRKFLSAVSDVRSLLPQNDIVNTQDVLELMHAFAGTWFSLDAYDAGRLPRKGATKKQVIFTAEDLGRALYEFKKELFAKKRVTAMFGQLREKDAIFAIVGNILQSFANKDVYPSLEEKAAHLLYFMVKNHPFIDGNKRNGAFSFVWFLQKATILPATLTPEALTALTLLVASSDPKDKGKIIGLILLLLGADYL